MRPVAWREPTASSHRRRVIQLFLADLQRPRLYRWNIAWARRDDGEPTASGAFRLRTRGAQQGDEMELIEIIEAKKKHLDRLANQAGAAGEELALTVANWVPRPVGKGLKVLLAALEETNVVIKPSSFDAIAVPHGTELEFTDLEAVRTALPDMIFVEIKTANQERVRPDFSGFFFALTESEITAAAALGNRHRVALYNNRTQALQLTSVPEILSRAKSTNWQVSVQL